MNFALCLALQGLDNRLDPDMSSSGDFAEGGKGAAHQTASSRREPHAHVMWQIVFLICSDVGFASHLRDSLGSYRRMQVLMQPLSRRRCEACRACWLLRGGYDVLSICHIIVQALRGTQRSITQLRSQLAATSFLYVACSTATLRSACMPSHLTYSQS